MKKAPPREPWKMRDPAVIAELHSVKALSVDGKLYPGDVVARAADPASPLHKHFTWDDSEAAAKWRMHEARNLINAVVEHLPATGHEHTVFVALADEAHDGGGYHYLCEVLVAEDLRKRKLAQAMREARIWRDRYRELNELSAIFAALDAVAV